MPDLPGRSTRERLLAAAAKCFAAGGSHGATTRAIASAAGVNEVTIFRLFGGKERLLVEAKVKLLATIAVEPLPPQPGDAMSDITHWAGESVAQLSSVRDLLRHDLAEAASSSTANSAGRLLGEMNEELARYLGALEGVRITRARLEATVAMFVAALVTEAIIGVSTRGRPWLPYEVRLHLYVAATLDAVRSDHGEAAE